MSNLLTDDTSGSSCGLHATDFLITEGVAKAYGLYALSVIKGRALPDIKDGLKPVQRRILYSMYESGYRYNKPFKKSARVVGEVLGKYHPHGDSSVYEALVNLAQDFGMSSPLIQGQGNFGSIDGDNAASMRYTEARLAQISEYLLQDYDKDTVKMKYNYDETLLMPTVLPAQFPNLLVNGSNGIAVGMATSIPPHNLAEVMDALIALIDDENLQLDDILKYIKGPDFPTGASLYPCKELRDGYITGRGKVIVRGTMFEEEVKGKQLIIIDSIPYQISKPKLIEAITNLVEAGHLELSDVRDESGRKIRIVLELKREANSEIIKQRLYAQTPLQVSISLNMVAIDNDQPITFNLLQALQIFMHFREDVVIKRSEYILGKAFAKAYLVSALVLATNMIDLIIENIKKSANVDEAQQRLIAIPWIRSQYASIIEILGEDYIKTDPYYLSIEQAKSILDLRLQKLTKLEKDTVLEDLRQLAIVIAEQKKIIQNRDYRKTIMKAEFQHIKDKFGCPRRTAILSSLNDVTEASLIPMEDIVIMLTANGYIKRISVEEYKVQNRGGRGKIGHKKLEDPVINFFVTNTHVTILFFTNYGKVFSLQGYEIIEGSSQSRGRAAVNLFKLDEGEKITTILPMSNKKKSEDPLFEKIEEDEEVAEYLIFITTDGTIRRNNIKDFENIRANGKIAMKLDNDNSLHGVLLTKEEDDLLLTSSNGNSIRFQVSDVRVFESRSSQGIRAIKLNEDDRIIGAIVINNQTEGQIVCVTENGYGKRSDSFEYRRIKRGGKGSKTMNINAKTGKLVQVVHLDSDIDILLMTKNGQTIRINSKEIRKTARVTSGVILIKLPANDLVKLAVPISCNEVE